MTDKESMVRREEPEVVTRLMLWSFPLEHPALFMHLRTNLRESTKVGSESLMVTTCNPFLLVRDEPLSPGSGMRPMAVEVDKNKSRHTRASRDAASWVVGAL